MNAYRNRLASLCLCLFAAVLLSAAPADAQAPKKKIVVGNVAPIALFWPDFIAAKQGFYTKEGLEVETIFVGSVAAAVQQVIGGSLDVAFTTAETAIRAADRGGDVTIIGETVKKWPYSIMAAKDVKKPQDLKGKKCILSTPKQDFFWIWTQWLRDQGMKPEDVDQVFDGATPNRYAALANNAVQCALLSQPFDFRAIAEGYTQLFDISYYGKEYAFVVVAARQTWAKNNPETARAFLRALAAAIDWFYNPANKEAAITILAEASKQNRALIEQTYDYYFNKVQPYSKGAQVPEAGMRNLVDTLIDAGEIKNVRELSRYMDTNYLPK
jgi:ABC-type nitrate/sulfonate/bicarbonate transport system substrate-binding protein